ncbi:MHS family MFS transporter [Microlunatus elymi]|uniref:MHS family MFS transporter n=1 Tax=Microlunatus elymi TaxID=2596828 RepID=A0A516PZY7_9ACTN|nr:MFS transporter [Microlunatus elymi]QDP96702.1 MHS family MFS transporter [Microlunatus elymi]
MQSQESSRRAPATAASAESAESADSSASTESMAKVAAASFIGTTIEFFDFYAYGLAAALVLNEAFFPELSPVAGTLAAFSTYAVAFVARPLGAAIFGHFGDRIGRKSILIISLLMMGLSTALVGVLPGYHKIGVLAPILLVVLRVIQGIGLGGEWGGAALLATEHAPAGRRARWGMFPQLGPTIGFILANASFLLARIAAPDSFATFGWRIPFLISFLLVLVGLWVRMTIAETPVFQQAMERDRLSRTPFKELLQRQWKQLLLGAGVMMIQYALFYTSTAYCLSYATKILGVGQTPMLIVVMLAVLMLGVGTVISANLADRIGRKRVLLIACSISIAWGLVIFPLMDTKSYLLMWVALAGCLLLMGLSFGTMGAYLPELFATRYRYSGAALSYSLGGVLGGALPPLLAIRLQDWTGSWAIGVMISIIAVISLLCVTRLPETKDERLDQVAS